MKKNVPAVAVVAGVLLAAASVLAVQELPLTQFVNPLIGAPPCADYGYGWDAGNVFPGAVCPRGMVAWSPDTTHANRVAGGYWYPDHAIGDFSLTHFSGRGVIYLKDIKFMPVVQPVTVSPGNDWSRFAATFSHTNEKATAGYYCVKLDDGIKIELTATLRTGMARFTFPAHAPAAVLIRADSSVLIAGNEVTGFHDGKIGGAKRPYTIYFAARFDPPFRSAKTWLGKEIRNQKTAQGGPCGAILTARAPARTQEVVRIPPTVLHPIQCTGTASLRYIAVDCFVGGTPETEPTWDAHVRMMCRQQGWNYEQIVKQT